MRTRPIALLSVTAAAMLLLAGCSGGGEPDTTPSATTAAVDLCGAAAPAGAVSDGITVEGEPGTPPTATLATPLEITDVQRTVVSEGDGAALADGDYVTFALTAYDAQSGEQLGTLGYAEGESTPQQITPDSVLGQFLGCAPVGSRVVATLPASQQTPTAAVYIFDVLDAVPADQWCAPVAFDGNAPTVTFGEDGAPAISIPPVDPPAEVSLEVLEEGDGDTVEPGDSVEVNYTGVQWSDGTTFDSSWERGETATFPTNGVVAGFQKALEGQTVGSTVLVSMPPACGYGPTPSEQQPLGGQTLVFVVDIVAIAE